MFAEESVKPLRQEDASACAQLMTGSESWITLRVPFELALSLLTDTAREVYVVHDSRGVAGFIVLDMRG